MADFGTARDPAPNTGEGPAADFKKKITELGGFWKTRNAILHKLFLPDYSSEELEKAKLFSAWKFNLAQIEYVALLALGIRRWSIS